MNKITSLATLVGASIAITACGGGGGGNNNDAPAAENATIRGVINETLPSESLPSAVLPSAVLPSVALPSASLPSSEVDETPTAIEAVRTVNVTLQSDQEVGVTPFTNPGANQNLTAIAEIVVDTSVTPATVTARVTAANLDTGDDITMVHIHSGFAGRNGPVILGLQETGADTNIFEAPINSTLDADDLAAFLSGGLYFNLHTASNPAGQLRGQIFTDDVDVVRSELESQQEVLTAGLPVERDTSGVGYFTYNTEAGEDTVIANLQVTGFQPELDIPDGPVHVHAGFAGANGGIIFPLDNVLTDGVNAAPEGVFWSSRLDAAIRNRNGLLNGGYYFNAHSAANPGGEVRGQILPGTASVERVVIETQQEIPAVSTPSANGVGGIGYITTNGNDLVRANVQVDGFIPALDGAPSPVHIHRGFAGDTGGIQVVLTDVTLDPDGPEVPADTFFSSVGNDITGFVIGDYNQGRNYINVHSAANASGEIRGQITPADTQAIRAELQGEQEPQGIDAAANPDATGIAYVTIDSAIPTNPSVVINASVSGFDADLAGNAQGPIHLHRGFAGANGPIAFGAVQGLLETDVDSNIFETAEPVLSSAFAGSVADDAANLLNGGFYINVHSAANGGGELRGQITPENVQAVRVELQSEQEPQGLTDAAANPDAAGTAFVTINTNTPTDPSVLVNARVRGFTAELGSPQGPVHLHRGFAGQNGGIAIGALQGVNEVTAGTVFESTVATPVSQFAQGATPVETSVDTSNLLNGGFYINVHSAANGGGELRGQVVPRGVDAIRIELQGQQENPPIENAAGISGVAYATVIESADQAVFNASVVGFTPELASAPATVGPVHVHSAFAGVNGPVVLPLLPLDDTAPLVVFNGVADLSDSGFDQLLRGGNYINVHSAANPGGELRGQVIPSNSRALRAELDGTQVLPSADDTLATGVGYLTVTDFANGQFLSNVTIDGLNADNVSVNVGGNNNVPFVDLEVGATEGAFTSPVGPVRSLNGILNGAYSFQAEGTEVE